MNIQKLISEYTEWLKSEITFEKIGEYYEITTPYLDNANDYLQIYVRQIGNEIYLTDDGYTIKGLKMGGFQFTPSRKEHLKTILLQYGVALDGDELVTKAPASAFPQKKHLFLQAMMRVDDMFTVSKAKVSSYFLDDIQEFFQQQDVFYSDNVQFIGKSGFSHNYDFLMQRSKTKPERLCQAVNNPNKSSMGNILFAWNDTKPSRKADSQLIVMLNDQNNITKGIDDAFANYDVKVVRWSEREENENLLLFSAS